MDSETFRNKRISRKKAAVIDFDNALWILIQDDENINEAVLEVLQRIADRYGTIEIYDSETKML